MGLFSKVCARDRPCPALVLTGGSSLVGWSVAIALARFGVVSIGLAELSVHCESDNWFIWNASRCFILRLYQVFCTASADNLPGGEHGRNIPRRSLDARHRSLIFFFLCS